MPKSPFLKRNKPQKSRAEVNRQKQKFAIWDYYNKKNRVEAQWRESLEKKDRKNSR